MKRVRITKHYKKAASEDPFNMDVSRHLPTLPRMLLKEAALSMPLKDRPHEIARIEHYVKANFPSFYREEARV